MWNINIFSITDQFLSFPLELACTFSSWDMRIFSRLQSSLQEVCRTPRRGNNAHNAQRSRHSKPFLYLGPYLESIKFVRKIHSIDKSNDQSILNQVIFPAGEWESLNIIQVQYARSGIKDQHLQILQKVVYWILSVRLSRGYDHEFYRIFVALHQ